MIRVAIVEDEAAVRRQLVDYLRRYTRQYGEQFEITEFADGDAIVEGYRPVYDLIFLDIQMQRVDGMAAAEHIRRLDSQVILIFITNMAQFAIRGYAVDALDFLLKPVPYYAFSQQVQKAAKRLQKRAGGHLAVPVEDGVLRLELRSVYYIESEGHKLHVWAESGSYLLGGTLRELEQRLAGRGFARCNSGYLVNLEQVTAVRDGMVLVGPYRLQISRPRKKAFLETLTDYIGGVAR